MPTEKSIKKEIRKEEEAKEDGQQYPPVAEVITSIFKTISLDETDVSSIQSFSFIFYFY
jgi:hypothetical protein